MRDDKNREVIARAMKALVVQAHSTHRILGAVCGNTDIDNGVINTVRSQIMNGWETLNKLIDLLESTKTGA